MAHAQIQSTQMDARYGAYKLASGVAFATTRALVKIHQMEPDSTQRESDFNHIQSIKKEMESEGVRRGNDIHGYIDVRNPAWKKRSQDEIVSIFGKIDQENKFNDDGTIIIGILPNDIPLKITNGCHRLHACCEYLDENWDNIKNPKPPLDSIPKNCPFANGLSRTPAEILAQDDASWIVRIEYILEPDDPIVAATLSKFILDLNKVDNTMENSILRTAALSVRSIRISDKLACTSDKRVFRWLGDDLHLRPIIIQLAKYPFLHANGLVRLSTLQDMSYMRYRSLVVLALCETATHLDHICKVLSLQPRYFVADQMWKHPPKIPNTVINKEDLSQLLVTRMDDIHEKAWEATLMRPYGLSPFTGKHNWADGSPYWTLGTTFKKPGWFLSKLNLASALVFWTIHFVFDQNIEPCDRRKRGVDYYLWLVDRLESDPEMELPTRTLLPSIWSCATLALKKGVNFDRLVAFTTNTPIYKERAIDIYLQRQIPRSHYSPDDIMFSRCLQELVDDKEGSVGQYSGWGEGGSLRLSSEPVEHPNNQGSEDDSPDRSPPPSPQVVKSKLRKSAEEQFEGPKGKGKPIRDDHKGKGKPTQGDDRKGKGKPTRDDHKGKGKPTQGDDRKGKGKPIRGDDPNANSHLRPSRKGQKERSDVYKKGAHNRAESPPGDTRDTLRDQSGGEGEEGTNEEEEGDGETGRPLSGPHLPAKCWDSFASTIDTLKRGECESIDDWVNISIKAIQDHGRMLQSMEKQS